MLVLKRESFCAINNNVVGERNFACNVTVTAIHAMKNKNTVTTLALVLTSSLQSSAVTVIATDFQQDAGTTQAGFTAVTETALENSQTTPIVVNGLGGVTATIVATTTDVRATPYTPTAGQSTIPASTTSMIFSPGQDITDFIEDNTWGVRGGNNLTISFANLTNGSDYFFESWVSSPSFDYASAGSNVEFSSNGGSTFIPIGIMDPSTLDPAAPDTTYSATYSTGEDWQIRLSSEGDIRLMVTGFGLSEIVPEPSTSLFVSLSALFLVGVRKRNK